jgi:L-2-hydroxyglutarate oxidase LhgO
MKDYDYVIIGAGIMGLTIARELSMRFPDRKICVLEKEADVAFHSSGRNSGVLHAGFYYTADSLKAKFTREGNEALTLYCEEHHLKINKCGKVVVATNEDELKGLYELKKRANRNGVELQWVNEAQLNAIDPNVRTYQRALYSPSTSTVDPVEVCHKIRDEVSKNGVDFLFNCPYKSVKDSVVYAGDEAIRFGYLVNAAGLYADHIAHEAGFGLNYTIIPFKGMYLKYKKNKTDVLTNIYPVPNLNNPFLGVHFTKTVDGSIKIGPTAIPAFWRENYKGFQNFKLRECARILGYQSKLLLTNAFGFRTLAFEEMRKYLKSYFINLSLGMVKNIDKEGFGDFLRPGIRAQLLNKQTLELVQDFVIEGDNKSMHVLNAVSPAFTCSFPFARHVVDTICDKQGGQKIEAS